MSYLATVTELHSQVMVQHLVVYDAFENILGYIPFIQYRIDTDSFGLVGITRELNRILASHPPFGSPGYFTVHLIFEVFTIEFIEQNLEIEITSSMAQYCPPYSGGSLSNFARV